MSSNLRYAAKRDANESGIIECLLKAGCTVDQISGTGTPDLLVGYRGYNILMEVKMPGKKLRPAQEKWHSAWNGSSFVVESVQDAMKIIATINL